jgi:hypothetical protein
MNTDINGLIKEDISDAIDQGRLWLEKHYRVCENDFILNFILFIR